MNELKRLIKAGGYSWQGFKVAATTEAAFRTELILFIVLAPVAYWLGETAIEYALLYGSLFLIMIVELLNTAVEAVVDRFGGEIHELSGRAKDIGSAAVFLSIVNFLVVWGNILYDRFF